MRKIFVVFVCLAAITALAGCAYEAQMTSPTPAEETTSTPEPPEDNPATIGSFEIDQPVVYNDDTFSSSVEVSDLDGIKSADLLLENGDQTKTLHLEQGTSGWSASSSFDSSFEPGTYTASLAVTDDKGNIESFDNVGTIEYRLDNKPEIDFTGSLPETVYIGDNVTATFKASDDIGLASVTVKVAAPDGVEEVPVQGSGVLKIVYSPGVEGQYTLTAEATDTRGQTVTRTLGSFTAINDVPPRLVRCSVPKGTYVYDNFDVSANVTDDRGIARVKISFMKQGKLLDEVALEPGEDGLFKTTCSFRTGGTIDWTITATDTAGQSANQTGQIVSWVAGGGGGGTSTSCFPTGTQITMADGSLKNIEDIKIGDNVLSFNESTGELTSAKVLELELPIREGYYVLNDGLLSLTDEHPVFARGKDGIEFWASLNPQKTAQDSALTPGQLEIGDKVFCLNTQNSGNGAIFSKQWIDVTSIRYIQEDVQTYNLKALAGSHTFFADGVLVHNKGVR